MFARSRRKRKKVEESLLKEDVEWFEGSILLNDGTELKGLVKYSYNTGVLSFQNGTNARFFNPSRITGFEFFDESHQIQRIYYSLLYENSETGVERHLFFELIKDYKSFAVFSRIDPVGIEPQPSSFSSLTGYWTTPASNKVLVCQTETIFLMNSKGDLSPHLKSVNKEDDQYDLSTGKDIKTTHKLMDGDLLREFIKEPLYKKLEEFAIENKLKFKRKEDFLKILDYYDSLIAE